MEININNNTSSSGSHKNNNTAGVEGEKLVSSPTKPSSPNSSSDSQNSENPAVTGIFYSNTFFLSWTDFFTLGPKTSSAAKGTYVSLYERCEMAFCIFFAVMWTYFYTADLYHLGRNLHELLPNEPNPQRYLTEVAPPKWEFMRTVFGFTGYDMADHQWRTFDSNLPLLIPGLLVYVGISQLVRKIFTPSSTNNSNNGDEGYNKGNKNACGKESSVATSTYPRYLALGIMNLLWVLVVHSWGAFFLLPILTIHYFFTVFAGPILPRWMFLSIMWISLTALLIGLEWNEGFDGWFKSTFPVLVGMFETMPVRMRWNTVFNMQILRLVAFSVDYLEAKDKGEARAKEVIQKHRTSCAACGQIALKNNVNGKLLASEIQPLCYKARTDTPRSLEEYGFIQFIAYILYLPLYIGGPISSFNGFASHIHTPQKAMNVKEMIRYAFRVCCLYFFLVFLLHLMYLPSIRSHAFITEKLTAFSQSGVMYWMLAFLWLKFSIIWKGFRLFGILDGVESPEDMNRCFANTVRVSEFWRDWHASFNLWIVRYMYIPLGGNKYKVLVVFPIFFFIAIWHDSKLELLSWAIIMCVNFALELVLTAQCSRLPFWKKTGYYYRYYVTLGGVYTIIALTAANAFGFGTGMESAGIIAKYVTREYAYMAAYWLAFLCCTCTISLIDREIEKNRNKKYNDELKAAIANGL